MIPEPRPASPDDNPYEGRWRWWYSAIADYMIRNPSGSLTDCAREMGKHVNTISQIYRTDLFQEYLAQRKAKYHQEHDYAVRARLTGVVEQSLDLILEVMKTKGNQIPLQRLESIATSALDRLGYAPASSPSVAVNINTDNSKKTMVVVPGLTPAALEEARAALRLAEQSKAGSSFSAPVPKDPPTLGRPEVEVVDGEFSSIDALLDEGGSDATTSSGE